MSDVKPGILLGADGPEGRDAIHVAIVPVTLAQILRPGDHVGLVPGSQDEVMAEGPTVPSVGIIDPYVRAASLPVGTRTWLFLYPQTITGLSHVWTHPAFPAVTAPATGVNKELAERLLHRFADNAGWTFDEAVDNLTEYADNGYAHYDLSSGLGIEPEVWDALEVYTGKKAKHRTDYFSCAC